MAHALTWDVLGQVRTNHRNRRNRVQSVHVNFGAGGIMGQTFFLKADVWRAERRMITVFDQVVRCGANAGVRLLRRRQAHKQHDTTGPPV